MEKENNLLSYEEWQNQQRFSLDLKDNTYYSYYKYLKKEGVDNEN